jgi:hypothetical protein
MLIDILDSEEWRRMDYDDAVEAIEEGDLHCSGCGEQAETMIEIRTPDTIDSFWAQCGDCAHETHCEDAAARWFEDAAYGL